MGFEPFIVFPTGHAIVGVVMGTNLYKSRSVKPSRMEETIVRLGGKSGYADVMFIESTLVADKGCNFADAVRIASKEVKDEMSYIMSNKMYSVVAGLRGKV